MSAAEWSALIAAGLSIAAMVSLPKGTLRSYFRVRPQTKESIALIPAFVLLYLGITFVEMAALALLGLQHTVSEGSILSRLKDLGPVGLVATYAFIVLVMPLLEELVFRGWIQDVFKHAGWPRFGVWLAHVLFMLAHMPVMASKYVFSVLATQLRATSGSLLAPLLMHMTVNGLVFLSVFTVKSEGSSPIESASTLAPADAVVWLALGGAITVLGVLLLRRAKPSDTSTSRPRELDEAQI